MIRPISIHWRVAFNVIYKNMEVVLLLLHPMRSVCFKAPILSLICEGRIPVGEHMEFRVNVWHVEYPMRIMTMDMPPWNNTKRDVPNVES